MQFEDNNDPQLTWTREKQTNEHGFACRFAREKEKRHAT